MVLDAANWPWSSYAAMLGAETPPKWLAVNGVLAAFGRQRATAIARYVAFVKQGIGSPGPWGDLRGQVYLGGEAFLADMQRAAQAANSLEIPRTQRRPQAAPLAKFVATACDRATRDTAIARAYASGDYSMQQIADAFGVHYSTVSRAVRGH